MSEPYYSDDLVTLYHGDCLDIMRELPDGSVDSIVTDPPYGLGFMGREWDSLPPGREWADECLRVLKPGGHLLAFGGTRTWHRLAVAVEDAGFEIRDSIAWLYGSGFPKSLDVSKAIDKARTEDRAPVDAVRSWLNARRLEAGFSHDAVNKHFGHASNGGGSSSAWMTNPTSRALPTWDQWQELKRLFGFGDEMDAEVWRLNGRKGKPGDNFEAREVLSERASVVKGGSGGWSDMVASGRFKPGEKIIRETAPATPEAERWQGWGTALKPAFEPIVVGRKPLAGTVAQNVIAHGTGALNIDACRVAGVGEPLAAHHGTNGASGVTYGSRREYVPGSANAENVHTAGRWPTNVVLDGSQADELDQQSGESRDGVAVKRNRPEEGRAAYAASSYMITDRSREDHGYGGEGGASRFFPTFRYEAKAPTSERPKVDGVAHPTVKPLDLMRWLVRLATPPNGLVLEPFAGSGTTAEACVHEHMRCIAIEREADYLPLIVSRLTKPIEMGFDFGGIA